MSSSSGASDFGKSIGMDEVSKILGSAAKNASDDVETAMNELSKNTDDPSALINVQMRIGIWSSITSTASSTYSAIKDMMSGIAQKI